MSGFASPYRAHAPPPPRRTRTDEDSSADEGEDADEFYDPQEYSEQQQHSHHPQHKPQPQHTAAALSGASLAPPAQPPIGEKESSRPGESSTRSTRSQSSASQSSSLSVQQEPASPSPDATSTTSTSHATEGNGHVSFVSRTTASPSSSPIPPPQLSPLVPARPQRSGVVAISTSGGMFTPSPSPALATPPSSSTSSSSSASLHSHHVRSASFNVPQLSASPSNSSQPSTASNLSTSGSAAVAPSYHTMPLPSTSPLSSIASLPSSSSTQSHSSSSPPSSPSVSPLPPLPPLPFLPSLPPLPPLPPEASVASPPLASTSPSSSAHSSPSLSASASLANPELLVVRNLDTNESCQLDQLHTVFPEVAQAMTISQLEALDRQMTDVKARERKEEEEAAAMAGRMTESEVVERRRTLGFLGKLAKTFSMPSMRAAVREAEGRVKVKSKHCDVDVLAELCSVQTIVEHNGPIWCVSVSHDGQFVATGGQDSVVRVWAVMGSLAHKQIETKQQQPTSPATGATAPSPATPLSPPHPSSGSPSSPGPATFSAMSASAVDDGHRLVLYPVPYRVYSGHRADVTSLDWSKDENFLLSASIDKSVRLWHVSSSRCIRLFPHTDFITSVSFHPIQHRYFISGSFDNRIRLWNILEHRVVEWAQTAHFVTAVAFSPSGQMVVAGLHHGQCVFYQTQGLKYYTQIDCRNRQGKHKRGKKVTGLEYSRDGRLLLVTTNDSRVRCYRMVDFSLISKMKGVENEQLQIRASFSEDGQHVIMGSDKEYVAVWKMPDRDRDRGGTAVERSKTSQSQSSRSSASGNSPLSPLSPVSSAGPSGSSSYPSGATSPTSLKTDAFEYFKALDDTVTCAIFLPRSSIAFSSAGEAAHTMPVRNIVLTTGLNGEVKIYANRIPKPTGTGYAGTSWR